MRSIEIDLDVHRAIENTRTDFGQSENAILRLLLALDTKTVEHRAKPRHGARL